MKLFRPHRPLSNRRFPIKPTPNPTSSIAAAAEDRRDNDEKFVSLLRNIVRGKQSWKVAFNNPLISNNLKPHHIEKVLLQTLDDDSRLALRFFNFLGLHKNFNHSTASFCILIHGLVQSNLVWPASSVLQTLILRGPNNPTLIFESLMNSYESCNFSSTYGFDLLIQTYVHYKRVLDSVLIVRLMRECRILPEVRTFSAVLNGLIVIKKFNLVLELFDEIVDVGLRPDVYTYTAVVRSLCELKDFDRAKEIIDLMESNGCELRDRKSVV